MSEEVLLFKGKGGGEFLEKGGEGSAPNLTVEYDEMVESLGKDFRKGFRSSLATRSSSVF